MEELLLVVLAILELVFEVSGVLLVDALARALDWTVRRIFGKGIDALHGLDTMLAYLVYVGFGSLVGVLSVLLFPHRIVAPSPVRGLSLLLAPLAGGWLMHHVRAILLRHGARANPIESFGVGAALAFGIAMTRLLLVR